MKKTGFIAIVGRSNVGKSTLLNALLGEKISIVSKKPQTTRTRITGILTQDENQFVFIDTPGMHKPRTKLGEYMVKTVRGVIADVDIIILMVEAGITPGIIELGIIENIKKNNLPAILVINKTDKASPEKIGETILQYAACYDFKSVIPISAIKNDGIDIIIKETEKLLTESDWLFPEDSLTDQPEKQLAAEIIREKLLRLLDEEIPHGTAVLIEEFIESPRILKIRAEIFCEKESHKGIIIGKNGEMLKKIGSYAREDMENFFNIKVYLNLWVKVKENWRDDNFNLYNFGYNVKK